MGLNVSASMGFENRDMLKNTAKNILERSGAGKEAASKITDTTIFANEQAFSNSQLSVLKASTQITVNNTLSETLKYLKTHAYKTTVKTPILGELWNTFTANNEGKEENPYRGELVDFKIDKNARNIFAA